jgi:molybdopterin converting factor subunit 1
LSTTTRPHPDETAPPRQDETAPPQAPPPPLRVLYFAWVRQRVGLAEEEVRPPETVRDVAGLVAWLAACGPGHAAAFAQAKQIRAAVNQDFATPDHPVRPGDEVAFFPPVTGG